MRPRALPAGLALTLACTAALATADEPRDVPDFAREVPRIETGEPVFQFNGKDLSGFYAYTKKHQHEDPQGIFTVVDGMIRASGEDFGGLATRETFKDYHLIVEWKWGDETFAPRADRARDSGILIHCVGPDGAAGGQWMESQECQIIEGGCGDLLMVRGKGQPSLTCVVREGSPAGQLYYAPKDGKPVTKSGGRFNWWGRDPAWKDVLGFRGPRDVEGPAGEWNRSEVICDGDTITNLVNGYVVNVGTKSSLTEGKIQLQSEGAEIFFRRVEVRPLKPAR